MFTCNLSHMSQQYMSHFPQQYSSRHLYFSTLFFFVVVVKCKLHVIIAVVINNSSYIGIPLLRSKANYKYFTVVAFNHTS